jgi:hypothetical protein
VGSTFTVRVPFGVPELAPASVTQVSPDGAASALRDARGFLGEVMHLAEGARRESAPTSRDTSAATHLGSS